MGGAGWGWGWGGERGWLSGHFGSVAAMYVSVPLTSVCHGAVYGLSPLGKGEGGKERMVGEGGGVKRG